MKPLHNSLFLFAKQRFFFSQCLFIYFFANTRVIILTP